MNCDSVSYPRADGLLPVRFEGTWNLHVRMRVFNENGNRLTTAPYGIQLSAAARDYVVSHDTNYIPAVGSEREYSLYVTHTWHNNTLGPTDTLTIKLVKLYRESSSFWPDLSLQLTRIWLTLNTSLDPGASNAFDSWLYGEEHSPSPPPPPLNRFG